MICAEHVLACVILPGGELEQIQFLLGHLSVQTTERYLGCKQKIRHAVNDLIGLDAAWVLFVFWNWKTMKDS